LRITRERLDERLGELAVKDERVKRRGRITKAGNGRMRWLLVEASWRVATHKKGPETLALREWADRIARRRGMRVAVVALARRLAGILCSLWPRQRGTGSHLTASGYFVIGFDANGA
jgi:transposase